MPNDDPRTLAQLRARLAEVERENAGLRRENAALAAAPHEQAVDVRGHRAPGAALRDSEERFKFLCQLSPAGLYMTAPNGECVYVNASWCRMADLQPEEAMGMGWINGIHPDDRQMVNDSWARMVAAQGLWGKEYRFRSRDGRETWVFGVAAPQCDADGRVIRYIGVNVDITARVRAQVEQANLQRQLAHAQKLEAIGRLAGGVAHDFNNVLAGVLGMLSVWDSELELGGEHRVELHEMMALLHRGAGRARHLLAYARPGDLDVRPLDLAPLADEAIAMFARARMDVTLQVELPADLRPVAADPRQVEQALVDLLLNAGHRMPSGGHLRVSAADAELTVEETEPHGASPGPFVRLTITDSGIGMDQATQERLFEPSLTNSPAGTGSGLASVFGIVKSHAGIITVQSTPGVGSTLTVHLPAAADGAPAEREPPALGASPEKGIVLVVDDDGDVLRACCRMLRALGYDPLPASSGREAVDLLRRHGETISLVVLDMIMPNLSGPETFAELRAVAPDVRVLISSGFSIAGAVEHLVAQGHAGFIQKPFTLALLASKLRELVSGPSDASSET